MFKELYKNLHFIFTHKCVDPSERFFFVVIPLIGVLGFNYVVSEQNKRSRRSDEKWFPAKQNPLPENKAPIFETPTSMYNPRHVSTMAEIK